MCRYIGRVRCSCRFGIVIRAGNDFTMEFALHLGKSKSSWGAPDLPLSIPLPEWGKSHGVLGLGGALQQGGKY